jgi:hypothetical protein
MSTPKVPATLLTERAGIISVAAEVNRLGLIWREQPMHDVGIDGQIELVDEEGHATGRIVAVQVKSGRSYLQGDGPDWRYYPAEKHRYYWEVFPLPVLLMLHSPEDGRTYWVDVRQALRSAGYGHAGSVAVPKANVLQEASVADLFYTAGSASRPLLDIPGVLKSLCDTHSASIRISYFDLFANGLTNTGHSLYYGMDLVMTVAEARLPEGEGWLTVGPEEHDFAFGFLRFLVEQNLADVDISNCLVDWHEREVQPMTIAPLTSRGRALVRLIHQQQRRLEEEGWLVVPVGLAVAQEDFVHMQFGPDHHERIAVIALFRELMVDGRSDPTVV